MCQDGLSPQTSNRASIVIFVLSRREMGHPAFAEFAAASNLALSPPGMRAFTSRWIAVIVQLASSRSMVRFALVRIDSGVIPAFPNSADSAIEKQPACAAATSSSGFVPRAFSKRVLNEYGACERTPLSVETVPLPSLRLPCQTADAVRFIFVLLGGLVFGWFFKSGPAACLKHFVLLGRQVDAAHGRS